MPRATILALLTQSTNPAPTCYFFDLPIRNMMRPITTATMIIPTQTPALKISAMAWQLERVTTQNASIK